jgi:methylmalonyl-CoA/ethylmalonyl-CoA epimerase
LIAFDHIAIATHRIADAPELLVGRLGGLSGYGGPSPGFRWWHWDYDGGGRIEVLEPDGPPGGFVHRFLDSMGPGIHHTTFLVPDLAAACARAGELGYDIVGYNAAHAHWKEAFLHPKQAMGIVVQLTEHSGGDDEEHDHRHADPPASPVPSGPPVRVVGVRLRAASAERALRQWGELLGGSAEQRDTELLFTWPGSPMRVAVTLEPGAEEQSWSIEVAADRDLDLPEGPHAVLGARIERV